MGKLPKPMEELLAQGGPAYQRLVKWVEEECGAHGTDPAVASFILLDMAATLVAPGEMTEEQFADHAKTAFNDAAGAVRARTLS